MYCWPLAGVQEAEQALEEHLHHPTQMPQDQDHGWVQEQGQQHPGLYHQEEAASGQSDGEGSLDAQGIQPGPHPSQTTAGAAA